MKEYLLTYGQIGLTPEQKQYILNTGELPELTIHQSMSRLSHLLRCSCVTDPYRDYTKT